MTPRPGPSRLWSWLLSRTASSDERAELVGDLDDEFSRRAEATGLKQARRWYRRQVLGSVRPLIGRRLARSRRLPNVRTGSGQDLRLAFRSLRRSPGFTFSVVLMLGLGIGAHTVVYAVVDALVLRPLPFGDRSPRLFTVHSIHPTLAPDWDDSDVSYADLIDFRRESSAFEQIEAAIGRNVSVSHGRETVRILAASMTPGMFRLLGMSPAMGRDFRDDEAAEPGFETSAIVSHALWQSLLGGDPDAAGRPVLMNGRAITIIGVMPQGFMFPEEHQLWLPYRGQEHANRGNRSFFTFALLRDGIDPARGDDDLNAVARRLAERHPDTNREWGVRTMPVRSTFVSMDDEATVLAAVSVLLLAACANIAGLLMARGTARQRELTVRAALGSGRLRLVRLLMMETMVLATAGGVVGLALAVWGVRALVAWVPEPPPYWATPAIDLRVAAFAIGLTALTALLAGLVPALRVSRTDTARSLHAGGRSTTAEPSHRRFQQSLVIGQVAVSLALLVGGLLLSRSATALLTANGGFELEPLLSLRFYIAGDQYDDIDARTALVHEIVRRAASVPGVEAVGATGSIPTDDGGSDLRLLRPGTATTAEEIGGQTTPVTAGFWPALSLALIGGRPFTEAESRDADTDAVIINQRLAGLLWPGASAIGRAFRVVRAGEPETVRVVGVAPDLVYEEFGEVTPRSERMVYVPYARAGWRTQALMVRTPRDPAAVADAIREEIRAVDPGIAVYDVMTMRDRRAYNHWGDRFVGQTFSAFALAAVLLACIGAYGIAAYGVAERRREIGVRVALGADRAGILRLFVSGGVRVAVTGAALGLPLAILTAYGLQSELFGISPWSEPVWIWPGLALMAAVVVATWLPAERASRTNPVVALRIE